MTYQINKRKRTIISNDLQSDQNKDNMFKKLKDKLAEEVKSSPQRIQQFAQAAQAAVTSASSSVSDITNSDLFSIGDNDTQPNRTNTAQMSPVQQNTFQDVSLIQPVSLQTSTESVDYPSSHDLIESQKQRRLSNSSFASDVSFRLPSYESPSTYHLQSDMEVSASEAEERGFSGGTVSLDRVTKEQIYAAYRRTQERYSKYRSQYADLARHYKLLERENAKAKSVLVETQDKALRRISELREQCSLEQSAKAHLEKALRVEIEERNLKIDTLNTKIKFIQSNDNIEHTDKSDNDAQLINLSVDDENNQTNDESSTSEIIGLNNKIEKLEQLVNKYKESLKTTKEKNAQINTELQILTTELENKNKENEQLKVATEHLTEARLKIQELNDINEELQNKINAYDFTKTKELSTLEIDLQKSQEEIAQLRTKIEIFTKREEEYAISLAENKLSIHKELETKESVIKSLKDSLSASKKEIESLNIVVNDYKNSLSILEEERSKINNEINQVSVTKTRITELESQLKGLTQKYQSLEAVKTKAAEECKFLELQLKQETAEKLAMIDRNVYLENRNSQLSKDNAKKSSQVTNLESELQTLVKEKENTTVLEDDIVAKTKMLEEINMWKNKYSSLELEIQEEREELVKLQSEIEKLLANHELIQVQNKELHNIVSKLKSENAALNKKVSNGLKIKKSCENLLRDVKDLKQLISLTSQETKLLKEFNNNLIPALNEDMKVHFVNISQFNELETTSKQLKRQCTESQIELNEIKDQCFKTTSELNLTQTENNELKANIQELQTELKKMSDEHVKISSDLDVIQKENCELKERIQTCDSEKANLDETINNMYNQYQMALDDIKSIKIENLNLIEKKEESDVKYQDLQASLKKDNDQLMSDFNKVEHDNKNLVKNVKSLKDKNVLLNMEMDKIRSQHEDSSIKIDALKKENATLLSKIKTYEADIEKFKENIQVLTKENISLKSQSDDIANSAKDLESELNGLHKLHAEKELEMNRLNSVIEILEENELKNKLPETITYHKNTQTNENVDEFVQEIKNLKERNAQLSNNLLQQNLDIEKQQNDIAVNMSNAKELSERYEALKDEHNKLKDENKRLEVDIAGLQSYLAKISKENSVLNDKLRELIASSENYPDKNEILSSELADLKNDIQSGMEKYNELIRENTLLAEENLELKDQLKTQNKMKSPEIDQIHDNNKKKEDIYYKEQYNNLQETKKRLEKQLVDMEQMNNSVNANMLQIQGNNEKLKLTNEKLERRLDEALVSLRHLHSLQENTELEYLRNILYEYLTGSGTHSITLAKVLAAVVKFDDLQTQQVLQKEKERQGILRQLGLI